MPLVATSAPPEEAAATQERHGRERTAAAIEGYFAALALRLVEGGVARLIAAGETSGAVTAALAPEPLEIGPRIAAGVPALRVEGRELTLALKSGNFGESGFFAEAATILEGA